MPPKPSGLESISSLPSNHPIFMLNMVKFKPTASYPSTASTDFSSLPTISGSDCYFKRYLPAFNDVSAQLGGKASIFYLGDAVANVITDGKEDWDLVLLVRYEDKEAFRRMATGREYAEIAGPHREAAVEEWKLVATTDHGKL